LQHTARQHPDLRMYVSDLVAVFRVFCQTMVGDFCQSPSKIVSLSAEPLVHHDLLYVSYQGRCQQAKRSQKHGEHGAVWGRYCHAHGFAPKHRLHLHQMGKERAAPSHTLPRVLRHPKAAPSFLILLSGCQPAVPFNA
jgi:hypothetical protein